MSYLNISRNEPCVCGSGKKYKKCCMSTLEILLRRFNNRDRWLWLEPQFGFFLALICGLPLREGERIPTVEEMEEALDYITKKVYLSEDKDEQIDGMIELLDSFGELLLDDERVWPLLLPNDLMDEFSYRADSELAQHMEEVDQEQLQDVLDDISEELLEEYVDADRTLELGTKIMQIMRLDNFTREERALMVFAMYICLLEPERLNPVWDQIFKVSLALRLEGEVGSADIPDPSWPIVKAFGPDRETMYISGFGSTGFVWEQPDSRFSLLMFTINLMDGGLSGVHIRNDLDSNELERLLEDLKGDMPPWHGGTPEQASLCIWGLFSLMDKKEEDEEWLDELEDYLTCVPKPEGKPLEWRRFLTGPGGFVSSKLLKFIKNLNKNIVEDIPEGKEIVILTTVTYAIWEPDKIIETLSGRGPDISVEYSKETKKWMFSWTASYPEGYDSAVAEMGGRKVLASGYISNDSFVIEGMTLSLTGRACYYLRELVGEYLTFKDVKWIDPLRYFQKQKRKRSSETGEL